MTAPNATARWTDSRREVKVAPNLYRQPGDGPPLPLRPNEGRRFGLRALHGGDAD